MRHRLFISLLALIILLSPLPASAQLVGGFSFFGRDEDHSYYSNQGDLGVVWLFEETPDIPYYGTSENWETEETTVELFLSEMRKRLDSPTPANSGRASAIINMMMGINGGDPRFNDPDPTKRWIKGRDHARNNWDQFEATVRYYDTNGWVEWNDLFSTDSSWDWLGAASPDYSERLGDVRSLHLGYERIENAESIVFYNPDGTVFNILKKCANLLGEVSPLAPLPVASFTPILSSSDPVVVSGDPFSFNFQVKNTSTVSGEVTASRAVTTAAGATLHGPVAETTPTISPGSTITILTFNGTATDAMGGRVCATLVLADGTAAPQACVAIGKKPLFQVWNGDVWAGGAHNDGSGVCSADPASPGSIIGAPNAGIGGSWGEYGVFALGEIKDFGSAAQPRHSGQPAIKLSFSNTTSTQPGYFHGNPSSQGRCLTDALNHFGSSYDSSIGSAGTVTNVNISGSGPAQGHKVYVAGDSLVKMGGGASQITQDKTIVVRTAGTMTISTDIRYQTTGVTGIDKIPQVLLMADNIIIKGNVGRIDAWLVAKNTIYTCDIVSGSLTTNDCDPGTPLVINSPVIANEIKLRRTHGADASRRNVPAEKFNLRPDVYLRAYADKKIKPQVRTVREQELPPRY